MGLARVFALDFRKYYPRFDALTDYKEPRGKCFPSLGWRRRARAWAGSISCCSSLGFDQTPESELPRFPLSASRPWQLC